MNLGRERHKGLQNQVLRGAALLAIVFWVLPSSGCQASTGSDNLSKVLLETTAARTSTSTSDFPSPPQTADPAITAPVAPSPKPKLVKVATPGLLFPLINEAARLAQENHHRWIWDTLISDQAEGLLEQGRTQLAVVNEGEGVFVGRTPLVLAVPFTSEWEGVTLEDAQSILADGHDLVSVLDWSQKPPTLKTLKIDGFRPTDPDYPLQKDWFLISAEGYAQAALDLAPFVSERFEKEPLLHLVAVGDIMLDRALGKAIEAGKSSYPFELVADLLAQADITVGNFESALGDGGQAEDKSYTFRAPIEAVDTLKLAGFDVLSFANNHAMDYGAERMLAAIAALAENGIATVGAGMDEAAARSPLFLEVHGMKLAFLAYVDVPVEGDGFDAQQWVATEVSPGVAWAELEVIRNEVENARSDADVVIVLLHSGYEYVPEPNEVQIAAAHTAIEAGAALVLGHHAHTLQPLEFYRGGVIAYGLGNFAFERAGAPETMILNIWIDRNGVRELEITPVLIQYDGRPILAPTERADQIITLLYGQTDFFAYLLAQGQDE